MHALTDYHLCNCRANVERTGHRALMDQKGRQEMQEDLVSLDSMEQRA